MKITTSWAIVAASVIAVVLAGCGASSQRRSASSGTTTAAIAQPVRTSSAPPPARPGASPATVVKAYFAAVAAADGTTACAQLAPSFRQVLLATVRGDGGGTESCSEIVTGLPANARRVVATAAVVRVQTTGDQAAVTVTAASKQTLVRLTDSNGQWQISGGALT